MPKKTIEEVFDAAIEDLKIVHGKEDVTGEDEKRLEGAAELLDTLQMEKTGKRSCKVGSTIPG